MSTGTLNLAPAEICTLPNTIKSARAYPERYHWGYPPSILTIMTGSLQRIRAVAAVAVVLVVMVLIRMVVVVMVVDVVPEKRKTQYIQPRLPIRLPRA